MTYDQPEPSRVAKSRFRRVAAIAITLVALFATACSATSEPLVVDVAGVDPASNELSSSSGADSATNADDPADSGQVDADSDSAQAPAPEPAATPVPTGPVATFGIDLHARGLQAIIDTVELGNDATTVTGRIVNGSTNRTTFRLTRPEETYLETPSGQRFEVLGEGATIEVQERGTEAFELRFAPVPADTDRLAVALYDNDRDTGLVDSSFPGFFVEGISTTPGTEIPALPAGLDINDIAVHPAGVTVEVRGIGFTDTHIGVGVTGTNAASYRRSLAYSRYTSYLEDDLGNRYWIQLDDSNLYLAEGEELGGTLVFGGRIAPGATQLTMVLNNEESADDPREQQPRFELGPWPLDGSHQNVVSEQLAPLTPEATVTHPNGASFTVNALDFAPSGTSVNLTVINDENAQIMVDPCCDTTYLEDDLGNRYLLQEVEDNRFLTIARGEGLEGSFSFPGRIPPEATTIRLVIGDDVDTPDGATDPRASRPRVDLGPWQLIREAGTAAVIEPPSGFGNVTSLSFEAVEQSEASDLDLIFREFSGIEIPGGVQLTLPNGILFDSGQSELQPGARDAIEKIVLIMDFYEGDEVIVVGHTDADGSEEANQALSEARADAVRRALIDADAPSWLLSTEGAGEREPISDNATEEGRAENRRVEIRVLTDKGLPS